MTITALTLAPEAADADQDRARGWQRVTLTQWRGLPVWDVHNVHSGARVGTLCEWTPGRWQADRPGLGHGTADTAGEAMAAVNWLVCITVEALAEVIADGGSVCVVLGDGSAATLRDVRIASGGLIATFSADTHAGVRVDLANPTASGLVAVRGEIPADAHMRTPRYTIQLAGCTLIALAPPCSDCETLPGQPCHPYAHFGDDYL